jgi:putative transposase
MPRKPRFYLPGVPAHVMQRGHNRDAVFFNSEDYREYLKILKKVALHYSCQIHAYVLMTNHLHLLVTPVEKNSISLLFQSIGRLYVPYINKTYQRSGTLWEGRHKGNIIESEKYFMICMKYIELNPVRANMVTQVDDYPWSSYTANAMGIPNSIISPHPLYSSLAPNKRERFEVYRELFNTHDKLEVLENIDVSEKQSFSETSIMKCKSYF